MKKGIGQLHFIDFLLYAGFMINILYALIISFALKIFSEIRIFTISISQMKKLRLIDAKKLAIF